jgi:GT2 family glycosyltransferase
LEALVLETREVVSYLSEASSAAETPLICIVVLNWNGCEDTLECLRSLEGLNYARYKVLVVDNGSSDQSVASIRATFPNVDLLQTGQNLGFSGGNNAGIKQALEFGADFVLLLNNDTVVDPNLLNAFAAAAKQYPDAGALSGKIYYYDDPSRIWYAGAKWDEAALRFLQLGEGQADDGSIFAHASETDYACGCAFFVSARRLREIGLLDDDYFLFYEETDWCYRARKAGFPSVFVPDAKLWHKVSVSFGGERSPLALYFITRNRLLWASRHAGTLTFLALFWKNGWSLVQRFLLPWMRMPSRRRWWRAQQAFVDPLNRAYFLALRDFLGRRLGNCPETVRHLSARWSAAPSRSAQHPHTSRIPKQRDALQER